MAPAGAATTYANDDKTRFEPQLAGSLKADAALPTGARRVRRRPVLPAGAGRLVVWLSALTVLVLGMAAWRVARGDSPIAQLVAALLPGPVAGQRSAEVFFTRAGTSLVVVRGEADATAAAREIHVVLEHAGQPIAEGSSALGVVYDPLELEPITSSGALSALLARPREPVTTRDGRRPWMVVLPVELALAQVVEVRAELR